jgi:Flp pilus assembly pilin Flp
MAVYLQHERENPAMARILTEMWASEDGQSIVEYAVMLALILVIVIGTIRVVGEHANKSFSTVAGELQQTDGD